MFLRYELAFCFLWLGCSHSDARSAYSDVCPGETKGSDFLQMIHLTTSNLNSQHENSADGSPVFETSLILLALLALGALVCIVRCFLRFHWVNTKFTTSTDDRGEKCLGQDAKDTIDLLDVSRQAFRSSRRSSSPRLSRSERFWSVDVTVAPVDAGLTPRDVITSVVNVHASNTQGEAWKRELSVQRGDGTLESWHLEYDLHAWSLSRDVTATAPKHVKFSSAGGCPFELNYPMCVMRGANLKKLQRFIPHEIARGQGLLLEIDGSAEFMLAASGCGSACPAFAAGVLLCRIHRRTYQGKEKKEADEKEVAEDGGQNEQKRCGRKYLHPRSRIIFVSHRWMSPSLDPLTSHPDDEQNSKLKLLQSIVDDDCWVFMDYFSIPQFDPVKKQQSIQSLPWYIYFCSSFKVVAPSTQALEAYKLRGFCQIEMLCAMCPVLVLQTRDLAEENDVEIEIQVFARSCDDATFCIPGEMQRIEYKDIKNPMDCDFTDPKDRDSVRAVAESMKSAYLRAVPGKKNVAAAKHRFVSGLSNEELQTTLREMRWCQ